MTEPFTPKARKPQCVRRSGCITLTLCEQAELCRNKPLREAPELESDLIAEAKPQEAAEEPVSKMSIAELYKEHGFIVAKKYSGDFIADDETRLAEVRARMNEYECDQMAPYFCAAESMLDARDTIARLEAENAGLREGNGALNLANEQTVRNADRELASLRAQVEQLQRALEPFAKEAARQEKFFFKNTPGSETDLFDSKITLGALRIARAALAKSKE